MSDICQIACSICSICGICCCIGLCEYDRAHDMHERRKLIDLPPLHCLQKDKYNKDCYLANINQLIQYDSQNSTYKYHVIHGVTTDSYVVRLIPHSDNKYQVWNTYNTNEKIDIESTKNFRGDLIFPWFLFF
jgi:hypothetical protein